MRRWFIQDLPKRDSWKMPNHRANQVPEMGQVMEGDSLLHSLNVGKNMSQKQKNPSELKKLKKKQHTISLLTSRFF